MADFAFTCADVRLVACASGALWWPAARLLCVADLHLGRSERLARRGGGLLPPYETAETLDRLASEIERRGPQTVICLGDSFDDGACEAGLAQADRDRLTASMAGRDWIWIAGNHDPGPVTLGGRHIAEHERGGLVFRHAPDDGTAPGEVAGHLHPKLRRCLGGAAVSRPCFLIDPQRVILPAFGAYTGGLSADNPAATRLLDLDRAIAVLTGPRCVAMPLVARPAPRRRRA
jgi:uncharacterized protein